MNLETAESTVQSPEVTKELDLSPVYEILDRLDDIKGMVIPVLQGVQKHYGYVPEEAANVVADEMGIYRSQVYGVLTFYTQFHLSPRGRHIIRACAGTACHVKGGKQVIMRMENELGIGHGGTTDDLIFSFEHVACIGACGLAPVIMIDDDAFGNLDPNQAESIIKKFRRKALAQIQAEGGDEGDSGDEAAEE
ncbi:MAG: NADH-quinone oxidoreductase subunit NuoE [bacterium]|nr:NADH-quinone oxidoreductase subunit NuoE [bacterium]MDT8395440.1 NADH-quinone oxidoreductase subunit NuoE [bacterium]